MVCEVNVEYSRLARHGWPMPIIPACREAEAGGWLELRSSKPAEATWRNPFFTKKIAWCGGSCLQTQLFGRLRWEDRLSPGGGGYSELRSSHCTPAWATEGDPVSGKKKKIFQVILKSSLDKVLLSSI
uniref:Uncharacterized protein n=1 Tax=Macaca fascicularis TaxID=9541 RepID=A0A7N9DB63_MACFA